MLDYHVLTIDYAVSYGSVTLKSLQNDNVPELDLLVREAIQNSSDASLGEPDESFAVSFFNGTFVPSEFNGFMTGIEGVLNKMFPQKKAAFMEIRDTKTCGLTGVTRKEDLLRDDHGNFFKLIYDTGMKQTTESAGGNWGFGKSVYYRVGIGIVVFYSRIKTEKSTEDRLIITLVENEREIDDAGNDITILNTMEPKSAGKAWWGIREGEDILPLTDSNSIKQILDVFNIKPFKDNETGTSIVIPYINTKELLNGIIPVEADVEEGVQEHFKNIYTKTISDYLRLSIQKWYAPKIHNRNMRDFCKNKWLLVSVDNKPIRKQDMLPFFKLTQELYTTALAKTFKSEYTSSLFPQIITLPVNVKTYFADGITAGYVSIIKITDEEMNGSQNVLSPYDYIGKFEADGGLNEPVVMYTRDPGMVIDYAINGAWVKNIPYPESEHEFLFAFFVPITNKRIKPDFEVKEFAGMPLGEYLRECEASDHMGWNDRVKMDIVRRMQRNTVKAINGQVKSTTPETFEATASKLSGRLGRNLLPRMGYGKKPGGGGSSGGGGSGTRISNVSFEVKSQKIVGNEIIIDYELKVMHSKRISEVALLIVSEAGRINASTWNRDIGTSFPVEIAEFSVEKIVVPGEGKTHEINQLCTPEKDSIETDELYVHLKAESDDSTRTRVALNYSFLNPQFFGKIKLNASDKKYQVSFTVE